ncbi:MAG TPA: hypothetical protein VMF65_15175 [Acidimicrobiales bacterium]|nr:hypothetical protein [Acidimicrobiales bacterium]
MKYQFEYEDRDARSEECHVWTEKPTAASVAAFAALLPQARIRSFQAAIGSSWLLPQASLASPSQMVWLVPANPPLCELLAKAAPEAFASSNGWAQS